MEPHHLSTCRSFSERLSPWVFPMFLFQMFFDVYPLVIERSYWQWPIFIVDLPIKNGDFPKFTDKKWWFSIVYLLKNCDFHQRVPGQLPAFWQLKAPDPGTRRCWRWPAFQGSPLRPGSSAWLRGSEIMGCVQYIFMYIYIYYIRGIIIYIYIYVIIIYICIYIYMVPPKCPPFLVHYIYIVYICQQSFIKLSSYISWW